MTYRFAVHGGAWNIPDELWPAHQDGCATAYRAGAEVLASGGSAVEAVATAIRIMEDDPVFDAGRGSFLNELGEVELDAGIMDGYSLRSGAVLGVSKVRHPIDLARHVCEHTNHCIFSGSGAHRLAEQAGWPLVEPATHIHERERLRFDRIQAGETRLLDDVWANPCDTVGAVALDRRGNLAAGNSTGGTINKAVGRVGDAPLIGLGFYADNQIGAFVCTGWGEPIMQSAMGMFGLHALAEMGPQKAAEYAVLRLKRRAQGFGGILMMAPDGRCAAAFNTQRMAYLLENHC